MFEKIAHNPSILQLRQKYELLPSRDRLALKVLSAVVFLFVLYGAIWTPAKNYMDNALVELEERQALLALVEENKAVLRKMSGPSQSARKLDSQQLVSTVTNLAKRQGLDLKRF